MTSSSKQNLTICLALLALGLAMPACKSGQGDTDASQETTAETSVGEAPESQPAETTAPAETTPPAGEDMAACDEKLRAVAYAWVAERYPEDVDVESEDARDRTEFDAFDDLNGDGKKERMLTMFVGASDTIRVLGSGSACDKMLAGFYTTGIEAEATSTAGWKDISSWRKDGCAGLSGTYSIYAWSDAEKMYAEKESVSCDCDPSPDRDERCPAIPE